MNLLLLIASQTSDGHPYVETRTTFKICEEIHANKGHMIITQATQHQPTSKRTSKKGFRPTHQKKISTILSQI